MPDDSTRPIGPGPDDPAPGGPPFAPPSGQPAAPGAAPQDTGSAAPPPNPYASPAPNAGPYAGSSAGSAAPPPLPPPPYGAPAPGLHGSSPPPGYGSAPTAATSGKATAVLVCGIASLVLAVSCGGGIIPAIVALVLAQGAERDILGSQGRLVGLGQVKAGRICSWIGLALNILFLIAVVGLVALGVVSGSTTSSGI